MAYNSKYSGAQIDELLEKVENDKVGIVDEVITPDSANPVMSKAIYNTIKSLKEELETSVNINDQLSQGAYVLVGKKGETLSYTANADGSFKCAKIDVSKNEQYVITGTGGGQAYSRIETITEDITFNVSIGYFTYSSQAIGSIPTVSRSGNGAWRCIERQVKAGEKYTITGAGGSGARLYCLLNSAGVIQAIAESGDVQQDFVLNVVEDGTLYCSFDVNVNYQIIRTYILEINSNVAGARLYCITDDNGVILDIAEVGQVANNTELVIREKGYLYVNVLAAYAYALIQKNNKFAEINTAVSRVEKKVNEIESALKAENTITEDITSLAITGNYTYSSLNVGTVTTVTRSTNGAWRCIAQPVKAKEKYTITGTGGAGARLYCLVDNNSVIKAIAESGDVLQGFELNVEEDGTLYCSFDANAFYHIAKTYVLDEIGNVFVPIWKSGSYEFGKTCNFDYTAPEVGRYSIPEVGRIVSTIYAWYDGLVTQFPNYVSKENCDEVMLSNGVIKPDALSALPMYMYKFKAPKAPNSSGYSATDSAANRIKAFVITGAHPEYTAIWDCYNTMKFICKKWKDDKNLEELRWNADIYVIPCYNLYGVDNTVRTNENGVDLNRNAPSSDWTVQGTYGDNTYSGAQPASEYSTKVLVHYLNAIQPQVFIDHHNTNVGSGASEGDGKNMIYTHCIYQLGIDISAALISQMTRKWKMRYTDTFPSVDADNTLFGYTLHDNVKGSIGKYAAEQGVLGSTYESNFGILYKNGVYSTDNRQTNTPLINTCATEGFINYLLRSLAAYSQFVGVNKLKV